MLSKVSGLHDPYEKIYSKMRFHDTFLNVDI